MDSSHGPHSHSRASHGSKASIHLQQQPSGEGEFESTSSNKAPPTIEIPADSGHGPAPEPTRYDYQPSPLSPGPSKRSNESKPTSDAIYPSSKKLRAADTSTSPTDVATAIATPTVTVVTSSTARPCPAGRQSTSPDRPVERSSSHRSSPAAPKVLGRSKSLPAPLRKRKRQQDCSAQAHTPPVTLGTLRELDLSEIYRNPKLRHDVVFDAQLHFRPNLDGHRGRRKREQSDVYWKFVLQECDMLFGSARSRPGRLAGMAVKLPTLFKTMKDILSTLVPKSDRDDVEAALDHQLLMQQLEHGVLNFKKLAEWLAGVLKAHCAPMRDQWVEQMVARVAYGVDNRKTSALVEGLKMVFGILEAMKLDVANHQIRTLRPHLVSTAVQFEQGYFQERIDSGRLDMAGPRAWFQEALAQKAPGSDSYTSFIAATTAMLTPSKASPYPATFTFDVDRLHGIRDDIREATCVKMSILFFRQMTLGRARRDLDTATSNGLRRQLLAILNDEEGPHRWIRGSSAVALHVAQAAHEFNGNTGVVDASTVKMAENWFDKHLRDTSSLYVLVEHDLMKEITSMVFTIMKGWSTLSTFPIMHAADHTGPSVELYIISQRIASIAFLHWRIFEKLYVASSSC